MAIHLAHWGLFEAEADGDEVRSVRPWSGDPEPAPLIGNLVGVQHHRARVARPHVRRGWLERGPGAPGRGADPFVAVEWETALDLLADELRRVYGEHGPAGVYGGSYGWASAGRFHHAQGQLHRFLNCLGGYVASVNSYSYGTSAVLLPHVLGRADKVMADGTTYRVIAEETELFVAFGGLSPKNSVLAPGGVGRHESRSWVSAARGRGCRFVSVSPLQDDTHAEADAEWIAPRPATDAALMLALAFVLDTEGLADKEFLGRYTVGYERFARYLRGEVDGVAKTPEWAEPITEVPAARVRALAAEMAASRTMITVSWSLQRTRFGEQPLWLGLVLAAMLGQLGLPGGGFGHGYGSSAEVGGSSSRAVPLPTFPQGHNGCDSFIPVARIADMLLNPGQGYDYDGRRRVYPDARLVYWSGGNPFHHHQDLARLRRAFARPDTVVVHDPFWTATARHADFVLPSTMSVERDDYGAGRGDPVFVPMRALSRPHGEARDDYDVFAALADRLGAGQRFTEGRTSGEWLRHLYGEWAGDRAREGHPMPSFDEFWAMDVLELPTSSSSRVLLGEFRADPDRHPLPTPSGRVEIFSETIAGFGYPDCPGHPVWLEPEDWLGSARAQTFPLHLIANQPSTRLHSQLDMGLHSRGAKIGGREPVRLHPADAAARGLAEGDPVRIFNDRGSCLAGLSLSTAVRRGVAQLSTGAWYDPDPGDPGLCRHGNPNVLTADRPASSLSQGCTGQHVLVEIEAYRGAAEPDPHRPPGLSRVQ